MTMPAPIDPATIPPLLLAVNVRVLAYGRVLSPLYGICLTIFPAWV